jgi:AraC-like DNA-binding protein
MLPAVFAMDASGYDVDALLEDFGLDRKALADPKLRLPRELVGDFWREAVRKTSDPVFGIHAAERMPEGTLDVVEHVARSSTSFAEAIGRMSRFATLLGDELRIWLRVEGGRAHVGYSQGGKSPPPVVSEFIVAAIWRFARQALEEAPRLLEVRFTHTLIAKHAVSEYTRYFQAKVRFGADSNELVFDRTALDRRPRGSDPSLRSVLERHAAALVAEIPKDEGLVARVRELIGAELEKGALAAPALARMLNVSVRTLHRRLRDEGTSVRVLVDEVRCARSRTYLETGELNVSEVAALLGFADESAFTKAFKRWTGVAPGLYRRRPERSGRPKSKP